MRCERCGGHEAVEQLGGVILCDTCVVLILQEWRIHREEWAELTSS